MTTRGGASGGDLLTSDAAQPNGFSIIEVLVAMLLVAIGAMAIAGEITLTMAAHTAAAEHSRAVSLAVQKMEEIKPKPPLQIVDESSTAVDARGVEGSGPYTRWVDVTDDGAGPGTKTVKVYVEYGAGRYGKRKVELQTIVYSGN